jgi:hypothetical protein
MPTVVCPHCESEFVTGSLAGTSIACQVCDGSFVVAGDTGETTDFLPVASLPRAPAVPAPGQWPPRKHLFWAAGAGAGAMAAILLVLAFFGIFSSDQGRLDAIWAELDPLESRAHPAWVPDSINEREVQQRAAVYLQQYLEARRHHEPELQAIARRHPDWGPRGPVQKRP